jgi:class 3 adenylate cyclase/small ligand-binding sensory domain FIST
VTAAFHPDSGAAPAQPGADPAAAGGLKTKFAVGFADHPQAGQGGRTAVAQALADAPARPPHCALLFATSRHDPAELLAAVRGALPEGVPVYGGYAVGIVTNDRLGYDGFQVGVTLLWLEDAELDVFVGHDLALGEAAVGAGLVQQLGAGTFRGLPSLLLLYDSVNRTGNRFRLNMATSLLEGSFTRLPQSVPLVGAGLVGDMQCRSTQQWTGSSVETQTAMLLAFSGGIEIEQVVLHGCRPASSYHEITRTDGPVVLEIDHRPAIEVIAELLGPESGRSWRDYAFFVTLGVNKGSKFGAFNPDSYANRMCMAVDHERGGLVMFEPDLRQGDLVQLMLRDVEFSYIGDNIRAHLELRAPRRPVFALYIDCAGRACAYSHLEQEEASFVQSALNGVCPLLGFYSGVEVARIEGRPQALDWTGVLAFFYEREVAAAPAQVPLLPAAPPVAPKSETAPQSEPDIDELRATVDYYRRRLDHAAGEQVRFDARSSAMSHRLRQKDEGFRVLANLRKTINVRSKRHEIYQEALGMVLSSMGIDRALVIEPDETGKPCLVAAAGYADDAIAAIAARSLVIPDALASPGFLIANKRDKSDVVERMRGDLRLPFFIAVPIASPRHRAMLVVGRDREMKPFFPPFDDGDVANFQAIANFLSSVVDNVQLYGEAEEMAASFRRFVPEGFLKIVDRADLKNIRLGDQVARHMAVLVTDIRSFSTLSERLTPDQVFGFINDYLAEVGPVVRAHDGFINKYIGDAVMALFENAGNGIDAAIALLNTVEKFNDGRRQAKKFPIQIGVAVNSGDMMLGMIGESARLEGAVLADAVNLCFRIEGLTKTYGAPILTTDLTLNGIADAAKYTVRPIDLVTVKGRRNHVTIMEVLDGQSEERKAAKLATRELYSTGFQSFEFGSYEEAAQTFREVAKQDPDDRAARAMMLKARKLAEGGAEID